MAKKKLTPRQAYAVWAATGGWRMIVCDRDTRRTRDQLLRLGLVKSDDAIRLTRLGEALGCLLARKHGDRLKKKGVQLLARWRTRLLNEFDIEASMKALNGYLGETRGPMHTSGGYCA